MNQVYDGLYRSLTINKSFIYLFDMEIKLKYDSY